MKRFATLLVGLALLVGPTSAIAQGSSECQTYGPETCGINSHSSVGSNGSLPFTGLNVALVAVVGGGLLGGGIAVRRVARRTN
jgi:hypothetical protein